MANKTTRETLHEILAGFQEMVKETPHVYFQPPESVKMQYPCFVYHYAENPTRYADDKPYLHQDVYDVTYITREAEPMLPEAMKHLKNVSFNRRYVAENLNHFAFTFTSMLVWTPTDLELSKIAEDFLGGN